MFAVGAMVLPSGSPAMWGVVWLQPVSPCGLRIPQPVGHAASVGSIPPPWTAQFFQLHCPKQTSGWPSSRCLLNHSCSRNARNAESILTPNRLVANPPAMEVTLVDAELQSFNCLHKISVSFPSSPSKKEFSNILSSKEKKYRCDALCLA